MHMITINNATCISSLTHSEHRHHGINYTLHLPMACVRSLYLTKNKLKHMDNTRTYLKS